MGICDVQRSGDLPCYASCDYTYKLLSNNLPVSNHGTVDANLRLWDTGFTITSDEKRTTVAQTLDNMKGYMELLGYDDYVVDYTCPDGDVATRSAWKDVHPGVVVATCWPHAARKVGGEHRHLLNDPDNHSKIYGDFKKIHSFGDNECRDHAVRLWVRKWKKKEPDYVSTVQTGWLTEDKRAFNVGATPPGLPNSNMAIERGNRSIKQFVTGHYRLSM